MRMGRESEDARAVVEFDDAHFDFISEGAGVAVFVGARDFVELLAVTDDGAGEIKDFGELIALANIFECAGIIFGGEEVIAIFEPEPFANVFKGVGIGPADANGFFGESDDLFAVVVDRFFGLDPGELVRHEEFLEFGVGVEFVMMEEVHGIFDFRFWI